MMKRQGFLVLLFLTTVVLSSLVGSGLAAPPRPHIVFIVADDMGYSDVGFHGAEYPTPTIDALANGGVKLDPFYVQAYCSPTRAAILTGEYPIRMGLQHMVIFQAQPVGVPLDRTLLPKKLKDLGYSTHIVGKWHLGFYQWQYTPTERGFDSHFGFLSADIGYFDYSMCQNNVCNPQTACPQQFCGYDMRKNKKPILQKSKRKPYSTELFAARTAKIIAQQNPDTPLFLYLTPSNTHAPLEYKQHYMDLYCSGITNQTRREYCAQAAALDVFVQNVTLALQAKGMLQDTLIFFMSDNGGQTFNPTASAGSQSYATNWPFRGGKTNVWEGGVRGIAFVNGNALPASVRGTTNGGIFHCTDMYNTILAAAGGTPVPTIDSVDAWSSIVNGVPSPRTEVLMNIDQMDGDSGALRVGKWKLLVGNITDIALTTTGGPYIPNPTMIEQGNINPCVNGISGDTDNIRLYDIVNDPSECTNVASSNPGVTLALMKRYFELLGEAEFPNFPFFDPNANPDYYGGRWSPWLTDSGKPISPKAKKANSNTNNNISQSVGTLTNSSTVSIFLSGNL